MEDIVNSPKHYKLKGLDCEVIDVIRACLTPEEMRGYLKGNVIKYILREHEKNGTVDVEKMIKYGDWLIEHDRGGGLSENPKKEKDK